MDLDPVILSRIQFAFVITFHIIFPAFTIGLAAWLATIEGVRLVTGNRDLPAGVRLLAQGVRGLVRHGRGLRHRHGVPVRHQLERAGRAHRARSRGRCSATRPSPPSCSRPPSSASCCSGRDRVSPWFYFFACCMVSLGTMVSSFWILANNSWMQVPVGHAIVDGQIVPADWRAIVLGPVSWCAGRTCCWPPS